MVRCLYLAVLSTALAKAASAALYPTRPISNTVYGAGRLEMITWMDDGNKPHLEKLGKLNISLYTADDVYVSELASNVNSLSKFCAIDIPSTIPSGVFNYSIHLTSTHSTVYTANFFITNPAGTSIVTQNQTAPSVSSSGDINAHPFLTLVLPDATMTSRLPNVTTREGVAGATVYAGDLPARAHRMRNGAVHSSAQRSRVDMEKAKFRLAFILWPTIVGISMAL